MARRVSWTNNSSGHSGTYVYRAPTLDPQNLPAPVATVDPVAQGETAEWIDDFTGYECYAVQDFDGQGVGALSDEVCVSNPYASATVGDYIGGGVYVGINTESDGTDYYVIAALEASEVNRYWKNSRTTTGAGSSTDGWDNTQAMIAAGIDNHPAGKYCVNYTDAENNADYYLPALSELQMVAELVGHPEVSATSYHWASTEDSANNARVVRFSDGYTTYSTKDISNQIVRPVRRVPV